MLQLPLAAAVFVKRTVGERWSFVGVVVRSGLQGELAFMSPLSLSGVRDDR